MKTKNKVLCQKWEESEIGWGTRPDGYSLHLSKESLKSYIKEYWDSMPDETPEEYSRPNGSPYWCEVDTETLKKVSIAEKAGHYGERFYGKHPAGGTDGWLRKEELNNNS